MTIEQESLLDVGQRAQLEGRHSDAERAFRAVLADEPENVEALHLLGVSRLMTGEAEDAVVLIRDAIQVAPERADFHCNLGVALKGLGRLQEAADALQRSVALDGQQHQAFQVLGDVLLAANDVERAGGFYQEALRRNPGSAGVLLGLGKVLMQQGRYKQAVECLAQARKQAPNHSECLYHYAWALYRLARFDEALELFNGLVAHPAYQARADMCAATIELELARPERALARLEELERRGVSDSSLLALKAAAEAAGGERQSAVGYYREALRKDPGNTLSWYELVKLAPEVMSDQDLEAMDRLLEKTNDSMAKIQLQFARARLFEHRGQWAEEFEALRNGNSLHRGLLPFDRDQARTLDDSATTLFDREWFLRASRLGSTAVRPLFIIGMPRSGTTLVEQILSSHSRVEATGESRALLHAMDVLGERAGAMNAEAIFGAPDADTLRVFVESFLDYSRTRHAVAGDIFTNKALIHYRFLPLLAAAFPRARFIVVSRDPLDLCFGCYKQLFGHGRYFAYDFGDCAFQLALFLKMIAHWRQLMPEIAIHDLSYESLIEDQAGETRRLLDFCGVEWEDACMDFQHNRRAVATASQQQVRRTLSGDGLHRGQRYGGLLDPLRGALAGQALEWRE